MHTKTAIFWDDDDPFPMGKRIDEAFNRVISFCPELLSKETRKETKPPELTSFNRVTGGDFDRDDIVRLLDYALAVHGRVVDRHVASDPVGESVLQAVENLLTVVRDTARYVQEHL
jgi:hypothetical protein